MASCVDACIIAACPDLVQGLRLLGQVGPTAVRKVKDMADVPAQCMRGCHRVELCGQGRACAALCSAACVQTSPLGAQQPSMHSEALVAAHHTTRATHRAQARLAQRPAASLPCTRARAHVDLAPKDTLHPRASVQQAAGKVHKQPHQPHAGPGRPTKGRRNSAGMSTNHLLAAQPRTRKAGMAWHGKQTSNSRYTHHQGS